MKKFLPRQQGFTLVELLIGMALTVLLLAVIFGLLFTSVRTWQTGSSRADIQQTARYGVDIMVRDLQYATKITISNPPASIDLWTSKYGAAQQITYKRVLVAGPAISRYVLTRDLHNGAGAQPVTGGGELAVSIAALTFTDLTPAGHSGTKTVGILLTVQDDAGRSYTLETAAAAMMIP
ncbi:MAG: prepilin-type N-terminal cleavage/methylation domain-containing protein [Veillonellales bacterium]